MLTDIEGSSEKWDRHKQAMSQMLARHDAIISEEVTRLGGTIIKHTGDGFFVLFEGNKSLLCALSIQQKLTSEDWGEIGELRVRIALGAGEAERRGDDYFGATINIISRILTASWGGQILLTPEVLDLAEFPDEASLLDLGVHLLRDISQPQSIMQLVHPSLHLLEFPALRTLSSSYNNLPAQTTAFFGRTKELAEVKAKLSNSCRLLTLTGPGGTGKTCFAIKIGHELSHQFSHGVCFVPLAPLDSPEHLVSHIAESLKFSMFGSTDPKQQLFNYLAEKKMLLIMDNFEHLIAASGLVSEILVSAGQVKIITTSRTRLNLLGESVYELGGLEQPRVDTSNDWEESATVQLFLDRARFNRRDYSPSISDRAIISEICQYLDGLPLGIELAASWIRMLSCEEILTEIKKNVDFLTSTYQDLPERHRSIQAVFESSWKLLRPDLGMILAQLSIMRGSFSLSAAMQTADANREQLLNLIDQTLIRQRPDGYLEMLEVIRQYAARKLDQQFQDSFKAEERRSHYYCNWLRSLEAPMNSGDYVSCSQKIAKELENCRASWEWAVANGRFEWLEGYLDTYFAFYDAKGWYQDAIETLADAVSRFRKRGEETPKPILLKLMTTQSHFLFRTSLYQDAEDIIAVGLDIAAKNGLENAKAELFLISCQIMNEKGEMNNAIALIEECINIFTQLGDDFNLAKTYRLYCDNAILRGQVVDARTYLDEALSRFKKQNSQIQLLPTLATAGNLESNIGDYPKAKEIICETIELSQRLGNRFALADALRNIGNLYFKMGKFDLSLEAQNEALVLNKELAIPFGILAAINTISMIYINTGKFEKAAESYEEGIALSRKYNNRRLLATLLLNYSYCFNIKNDYKEAEKHILESMKIFAEFQNKTLIIKCMSCLADLYITTKDFTKAESKLMEALKMSLELQNTSLVLPCLAVLCRFMLVTGQGKRLTDFATVVIQHPSTRNEDRAYTQDTLDQLNIDSPEQEIPKTPIWEPSDELNELTDRVLSLLASKSDSEEKAI